MERSLKNQVTEDTTSWVIAMFKFINTEFCLYALLHTSNNINMKIGKRIASGLNEIPYGYVVVANKSKNELEEELKQLEEKGELVSRDIGISNITVIENDSEEEESGDTDSELKADEDDYCDYEEKPEQNLLNQPKEKVHLVDEDYMREIAKDIYCDYKPTFMDIIKSSEKRKRNEEEHLRDAERESKNGKRLNRTFSASNFSPPSNNYNDVLIDNTMTPIGTGQTFISMHLYNTIDWNNYRHATRSLLAALFTRRELATHSLTGKSFSKYGIPKPMLEEIKIRDLIITVVGKCHVTEREVKSVITTKCSDEEKMYRKRMLKRQKLENMEELDKLAKIKIEKFDSVEEANCPDSLIETLGLIIKQEKA